MLVSKRFLTFCVLSVFVCVLSGCGNGMPTTYPVSGKVTLDGKPLPYVKITFMPSNGDRSASAVTDGEGVFDSASTFRPNDGVRPGTHKIVITSKHPPQMPGESQFSPGGTEDASSSNAEVTPPFPAKYGIATESGLTATVKEQSNEFTFALESK